VIQFSQTIKNPYNLRLRTLDMRGVEFVDGIFNDCSLRKRERKDFENQRIISVMGNEKGPYSKRRCKLKNVDEQVI